MVPKSPALEKGHAQDTLTRRRFNWSDQSHCRLIFTMGILVICLFTIGLRYSKLSPSLLFYVAHYRLMRGMNPLDSAVMDVTRSRLHKTTLRPSLTYELHSLEATGVFADWYGDPSKVGPSPFDYAIPPEWQAKLPGRRRWTVVTPTSGCMMQSEV